MVNKLSKENLKKYRDKIDVIDSKLLKLMQTRANAAYKIGQIKSELDPNSSLYKPDREADVLINILKKMMAKYQIKK
jgi:chorismate mutase/prephenate dehydratase